MEEEEEKEAEEDEEQEEDMEVQPVDVEEDWLRGGGPTGEATAEEEHATPEEKALDAVVPLPPPRPSLARRKLLPQPLRRATPPPSAPGPQPQQQQQQQQQQQTFLTNPHTHKRHKKVRHHQVKDSPSHHHLIPCHAMTQLSFLAKDHHRLRLSEFVKHEEQTPLTIAIFSSMRSSHHWR